MDELWMRSVATVYEGRIEDFKRLAEEMLSTIREKDSDTLNFAIFLDEPTRVAVFLEEYASSAGWLAHRANFGPLLPRVPEVCEFTVLPDIPRYDRTRPAAYPNGRLLTDDPFSAAMAFLTHGQVTSAGLRPHGDLLAQFPFLGLPNSLPAL